MSAIPLRDYVVGCLVSAEVVDALLVYGEPMLSETIQEEYVYGTGIYRGRPEYRAWIRLRGGGRVMGHPWHSTPQFAATALLEKLRGGR